MNFFEDQEIAKRKTNKLVFLFFLSTFCTAIILCLSISLIFYIGYESKTYEPDPYSIYLLSSWKNYAVLLAVFSLGIFLISVFKISLLGTGGEHVAQMLGATKVKRAGADRELKKYINIVEEMSIASGAPIPKIYIMENEEAINAFAAGYDINDCVVCVTRGAIKNLTRDELQGVIAHEFSHIFNGDMKLNIKLIGYLAGLLAISQLGEIIMRSSNRRVGYSSKKNDNGSQIFLVGVALFAIGGVGYLLGSLIKSSVSKQREFLADASAVQYTRNPFGIGGALLKIFKLSEGSTIMASKASEASHMFFATVMKMNLATHPSLEERLKRVYPNRSWEDIKKDEILQPKIEKDKSKQLEKQEVAAIEKIFMEDAVKVATAGTILSKGSSSFSSKSEHIGEINKENVKEAHNLINSVPYSIREKIQTTNGAQQIILDILAGNSSFKPEWRYAIFEIGLGTLDELSHDEKKDFVKKIKEIVLADKKITASEFIHYFLIKDKLIKRRGFFEEKPSKHQVKQAYLSIVKFCRESLQDEEVSFKVREIDLALKTLGASSFRVKKQVLGKILEIVESDDHITVLEEEFIRLICQSFKVPYPL